MPDESSEIVSGISESAPGMSDVNVAQRMVASGSDVGISRLS